MLVVNMIASWTCVLIGYILCCFLLILLLLTNLHEDHVILSNGNRCMLAVPVARSTYAGGYMHTIGMSAQLHHLLLMGLAMMFQKKFTAASLFGKNIYIIVKVN